MDRGGVGVSATVNDICMAMERIAPSKLAEDWDNTGLAVGDIHGEVKKILIALDVIEPVIEEAKLLGADMILTHHPMLLFQKFDNITTGTPLGRRIFDLVQNNIAALSAHTNLDTVEGGTNDILAGYMDLQDIEILEESHIQKLKKIVVYVPADYVEAVRTALCEAGAGHIGGYAGCTFETEGIGTFLPLDGTKPHIGEVGRSEKVAEIRLETIVPEMLLSGVIAAMRYAHPYEEVAYDIYAVEQKGKADGIGRVGNLPKEMTLRELALLLRDRLGLDHIRLVGNAEEKVRRVGLCTGSGAGFMAAARERGTDVYLTGDMKYHEAQKAVEMGLCVIDVTHYASEVLVVPVLKQKLEEIARENGWDDLEIICSKIDGQTFWNL